MEVKKNQEQAVAIPQKAQQSIDTIELGTIKNEREIGRLSGWKYILSACSTCGRVRWVQVVKGKAVHLLCPPCSHKGRKYISSHHNSNWRGGRQKGPHGYILVFVEINSPFFFMAKARRSRFGGFVPEHRLVLAQSIGRCLLPSEHVHHKNGIVDDNRLENLELISQANHNIYNKMCSHCALRKEIRLLRWQIRELTQQTQRRLV